MRALMYHYVRERDETMPYFRYLDIINFRQQLDYLSKAFGFVEKQEFDAFLDSGVMPVTAGKVLLTFDDGFSDHFQYVFPELERRGLWGMFYIPVRPYLTCQMLDVHRIHLLCGTVEGAELFDATLSIVSEDMMPDAKISEFRTKTYTRQKNKYGVSEVKRVLNYFIDYKHRATVIHELCRLFGVDCPVSKFYLTKEQCLAMHENGQVIGSHTVNHPLMSKLDRAQQEDEITSSFDFLRSFLPLGRKTYCHPYGGFHSFNSDTVNILNKHNVDFSFNVESREIHSSDRVQSKQYLPRFDCNEFPFGKAN